MALYPSLEDMKVHQIQQEQVHVAEQHLAHQQPSYSQPGYGYGRRISDGDYTNHSTNYYGADAGTHPGAPSAGIDSAALESAYPSLMDEYMGLRLEPPSGPIVAPPSAAPPQYGSGQIVAYPGTAVGQFSANSSSGGAASGQLGLVAPLSGNDVGLRRANVTHGVREVILCKDAKGKCGMRLRAISKGIFVQFVTANSPAALAGVRFGDQLLQVDGQNLAGFSDDKAMAAIRKANPQRIVLAVRDRPYERTMTLHKDSTGHIGFMFKNGKITAISKDTSAARNGLLTDHQLLEVGGQNVVGLKDSEVTKLIDDAGQIVTVTIMPSQIFDHMIKNMASGLVKKLMDHSIPEI